VGTKPYEIIEHTADIGIRVKAGDLKELFNLSALAMFDIIAEKSDAKQNLPVKIKIEQRADNLDELFVNWLNELLSLSAIKELIFFDFQIKKINKNFLRAVVFGRSSEVYKVNVEIKAATYHELKIEEDASGWKAEVIFDV
jgi:SHS2 domain-containing protein